MEIIQNLCVVSTKTNSVKNEEVNGFKFHSQ